MYDLTEQFPNWFAASHSRTGQLVEIFDYNGIRSKCDFLFAVSELTSPWIDWPWVGLLANRRYRPFDAECKRQRGLLELDPSICYRTVWRHCLWCKVSVMDHGGSWKRLYFERRLWRLVENFVPRLSDPEELSNLAAIGGKFVQRLEISELMPPVARSDKDPTNIDDLGKYMNAIRFKLWAT